MNDIKEKNIENKKEEFSLYTIFFYMSCCLGLSVFVKYIYCLQTIYKLSYIKIAEKFLKVRLFV